ncbi:MAG TPA: YhjD/YihY/BrkB family envelope integrity protein [Syntrophales bacterium]|nr:YhjD/YihY/BrkB family envelope integrity protein [Syntrophales bacterium]
MERNADRPPSASPRRPSDRRERLHLGAASAWDILADAAANFRQNGDVNQAAAIAFYAILSVLPLIILTVIVAGKIFGSHPQIQEDVIASIRSIHPYFSGDLIKQLGGFEQKQRILGWAGIIGLVWLSTAIFGAMEKAMNVIFRSHRPRKYVAGKILAIAMIPMGWLVGVASIAITYVGTLLAAPSLLGAGAGSVGSALHGFLFRYVAPYLLTVLFFTVIYRVIPTARVSLGNALAGSAVFALLMETAKNFFTWYISSYTRYNVIFGSLETVVILVLWVFYVAIILLFCAELVSSYQRRDLLLVERVFLKASSQRLKTDERLFRKFGRIYPEGSWIFREGDGSRSLFYVLGGRIRLEKEAGRIRKTLAEIGPGSYFGEMAALIEAPRTASAVAAEDSRLAVIGGDTLRDVLRESSEVSLFMLREFSRRLKQTTTSLEELAHARIALLVLLRCMMIRPEDPVADPMPDLARLTGKGPDELAELIGELRGKGVLIMDGERIRGCDREKVRQFLGSQVLHQPADTKT